MQYTNPTLHLATTTPTVGSLTWRAPSNIALVKYWGKWGQQLPKNPSVSLTLTEAYTETTLHYAPRNAAEHRHEAISLEFEFEGVPNEAFRVKQVAFLESLLPVFPFLQQLQLRIVSRNSFPHSAGIASSASSMAALACCLVNLEQTLFGTPDNEPDFLQKASYIARLGSGSAARSVTPLAGVWGETAAVDTASDFFAVSVAEQLHPIFTTFHDDILFVSRAEKAVSSRAGHSLMDKNPYAEVRYAQARKHLYDMMRALTSGDLEAFGDITEREALTLHALMMTSSPSFVLMRPNTLAMIEALYRFRKETHTPVFFTLDAGPNLHLLYPASNAAAVQLWRDTELRPLCEAGTGSPFLADRVGEGAKKI